MDSGYTVWLQVRLRLQLQRKSRMTAAFSVFL